MKEAPTRYIECCTHFSSIVTQSKVTMRERMVSKEMFRRAAFVVSMLQTLSVKLTQ